MPDRCEIWLDGRDVVAAAQILSWVAWPHRPNDGVDLLQQWFLARKRHRGEPVTASFPVVEKRSRIEPKLTSFNAALLRGFRAGQWFELKSMSGPLRPPMLAKFSVSTRELAARRAALRGSAQANEIRDIWSRRKPLAHLAAAAGNAIAMEHQARNTAGFDLAMTVFDPVWIETALAEAESRASASFKTGAFQSHQLYRFCRDGF